MRLRGTAQQLFEKYLQLGRDATGAGDRVMAESYFQHAEHYFRILNAMAQAAQQANPGPRRQHSAEGAEQGDAPQGEGEAMAGHGQAQSYEDNAEPAEQRESVQ